MKSHVIVLGIGEMGGVFARGILKIEHPVYPLTRRMNLAVVAEEFPNSEAVIVAVGEKDLLNVLKMMPSNWQDRLVLLQNELLPRDWLALGIKNPTVISVWFEKKYPQDYKVIIPSVVFGPKSELIEKTLTALGIPIRILKTEAELISELVLKNLYILTINICGLVVGGTVEELWNRHQTLVRDVAYDVLDLQEWLTGKKFDREQLIQGMVKAFEGDPQHKCLGRTAPIRLQRAIQQADKAGLSLKKFREISALSLKK